MCFEVVGIQLPGTPVVSIGARGITDGWVVEAAVYISNLDAAQVVPKAEEKHLEKACEVSRGGGAIGLFNLGEEAMEELVARDGLESVLGAITRSLLVGRFGLIEANLSLIETPLVNLKHVGP